MQSMMFAGRLAAVQLFVVAPLQLDQVAVQAQQGGAQGGALFRGSGSGGRHGQRIWNGSAA